MAPQIIMLSIVLLNLLISAHLHGKPKKEKNYNFFVNLIAYSIQLGIMYWGGFFDVFFK